MRRITRAGLRGVGLLAATGALCAAAVGPAAAAEQGTSWQPELVGGSGTGVVVAGEEARFDRSTAVGAPVDDGGSTDAEAAADPVDVVPTGLLTLEPRTLGAPTREVTSALVADTPAGSSATIDVRGREPGGGWTEWIPAEDDRVELPEAVREVQGRLVLTATGEATPSVREVTLTAAPVTGAEAESEPLTEAAPRSYSVFATREGLVGGTTANGHTITPRDRFVALPSRRALSADGETDYSVKVCAPNGRCAIAPVWDIGPWNTKDDYWNPSNERQMWKELPQGLPQAAAAFNDGHNGGKDQFGRKPSNPAGIDLGDGIFWDVLGLKDNSQVQVDYLWTGSRKLSAVNAEGAPEVDIVARPEAGAESVGIAVDDTEVPVECTAGGFVRIGAEQYLPESAFAEPPADVPACDATAPVDATAPAPGAGPDPADAPETPDVSDAPNAGAGDAPVTEPGTTPGTTEPGTGPGTTEPGATEPDATEPGTAGAGGPAAGDSGDGTTARTPGSPGDPSGATPASPGTGPANGSVPAGDRQAAGPDQPGSAQRARSGVPGPQ